MGTFWQDVRYGLRTMARSPGFTIAAVVTLTLGIGATSSIFTVVNAVLLESLPYQEPDRLVEMIGVHREQGTVEDWPISYLDFLDWRDENRFFEQMAVVSNIRAFNLVQGGDAVQINAEMASWEFFNVLKSQEMTLGRFYTSQEDQRGSPQKVVVASYDFWQNRYGGDSRIVGKKLLLNEQDFEVVGVMPKGFRGVTDEAEIWVPVTLGEEFVGAQYIESRQVRWLSAVGRLKRDASLVEAQEELDAICLSLEEQFGDTNKGHGVRLRSLAEAWFGELRIGLMTLFGAAGFVLLIACTNVANLLLARSARRQRELSLRAALGAKRTRLARQLLTESLILATLGCLFGLLLAEWSTSRLVELSAIDFRSFTQIKVAPLVIAGIGFVSLVSGVGFGLAPAWLFSRADLVESLKVDGSRSGTFGSHLFQKGLVVAEVALAMVLLVGAALMIQSFQALRHRSLGFKSSDLLVARLDMKGERYAQAEAKRLLVRQILERAERIRNLESMALAGPGVPTDSWFGLYFSIEDRPVADGQSDLVLLPYHAVSPGYFETLGIPTYRGRVFAFEDDESAPLRVVVSRAFAERYWPDGDPIGKRLKAGPRDTNAPFLDVIGVVEDVRHQGLANAQWPGADIYLSMLQVPPARPARLNFLARPLGNTPASNLSSPLREVVRAIDPRLPVYGFSVMDALLDQQASRDRFLALLMNLFAALALALASVGIYGVIAYTVAQRTHEIGTRMALGAKRVDVLRMVIRQAVNLALLGVLIGLGASWALTSMLSSLLYGVTAVEWSTMFLAALVLILVAVVASFLPARWATRVEPMVAFRGAASSSS